MVDVVTISGEEIDVSQHDNMSKYVSTETDFTSYTKIMFIDNSVERQPDALFSNYCLR